MTTERPITEPVAPVVADPAPEQRGDGAATHRRRSRAAGVDRRPGIEARQVTRIVRRVEPWSVVRVAFAFLLSIWLILLVAGVILWQVATAAGVIGNVESFVAELLADETFTLDGAQLLRSAGLGGALLVVAGTAFSVLLAVLFNLISELTGGLRVSVIELETARRPTR